MKVTGLYVIDKQNLCYQFLLLKGYLSSVWISIEQSVMLSGIVYVFLGFGVHDWSYVQLSLLIMGDPTGALTTIGCLIIF